MHRRLPNSRFYWKLDIEDMDRRLADLEADGDMGKPGAQERLEAFREQRMHLVDSIVQVGSHYVAFHFAAHSIIHEIELRRI